ncbi:MAG: ArdC-like ssDNA-binding domain-containing protein [Dehalococcoidales bacterium]|nr:ArdC-like ssDNA-binding domain-containing protein [Dehalococcoidales bacterium]
MVIYRSSQQQMNDVFAFGLSLMFMGLMLRLMKSLVLDTLQAGQEHPGLMPQTSRKKAMERQLLPQVLSESGERIPTQYRNLITWIDEPLPDYSLAVGLLPAIEAPAGERKIDAILKQLKDGVEGIQQNERFRLFLSTMARFHDYSIGNLILIMIQKPEAIRVAGFNTWKDLRRWVKSGEKGIAILAPVMPPRPTCPKCGTKIRKGVRFCPQCGEPIEAEEGFEATPHYFKVVYVFDLSQTDGKPLPEFEVPSLTGEANEELFNKALILARGRGLDVSFDSRPEMDPSIKGFYSGKLIWVRPEEPRAQQLKTLLHELAHYYSEGVFLIPRRDAETIAESAAFAVGAHFGFDSGVRSFPYVAVWAQDKKVLEQNLAAIRKVTVTILESLEKTSPIELVPMIIKCAWCGKCMGEKPPYEDKSITHTICDECGAKYFPKKGSQSGNS